jgi:hypothetical protein
MVGAVWGRARRKLCGKLNYSLHTFRDDIVTDGCAQVWWFSRAHDLTFSVRPHSIYSPPTAVLVQLYRYRDLPCTLARAQ